MICRFKDIVKSIKVKDKYLRAMVAKTALLELTSLKRNIPPKSAKYAHSVIKVSFEAFPIYKNSPGSNYVINLLFYTFKL